MLAEAAKVAKGIPREPAERRGKIPALRSDRATGTRQIQPGPRRRKLLSNLRPPLGTVLVKVTSPIRRRLLYPPFSC
jgi:hypothetical protein